MSVAFNDLELSLIGKLLCEVMTKLKLQFKSANEYTMRKLTIKIRHAWKWQWKWEWHEVEVGVKLR